MKKSYMDRKNILSEGFFDKIRRAFGLSTSQEKILKKDKEVQAGIKDMNDRVERIEKILQKKFKKIGIDKKIKLSKYTVNDFLKK